MIIKGLDNYIEKLPEEIFQEPDEDNGNDLKFDLWNEERDNAKIKKG